MRWIIFIISLSLSAASISADEQKTVCVNMIVKNESDVIRRCLTSVKPLINYWVIVDTGSTDGTQEIIKEFMKDVPGELHERPWINFAHNRNEALNLAKQKADYVLFIDADEIFTLSDDFKLPSLDKDFYYIVTDFSGTVYNRVQLINNHLDWKWIGVLHEALDCKDAKTCDTLKGIRNFVRTDGARSKDPKKFQKDAAVLEKALIEEPDNKRYMFYLAQSYRDADMPQEAIKNYEKRIAMGGWDQEIFWSMLQIGLLKEALNEPTEAIIESYNKAYNYRPTRAESLYRLATFHRKNSNYLAGYETAKKGLFMPCSPDILFVEKWIYDYGLLLEFSICAYWSEKYMESLLASQLLLANPSLPQNIRDCAKANLVWIHLKLKEAQQEAAATKDREVATN